MRKVMPCVLVFLAVLVTIVGGIAGRELAVDQTLHAGLEAEVSCLDPHLGFDAAQDLCVRQYVYDRLVHFENPGLSDWNLAPGLAKSWPRRTIP
jgi:ABC-type transport system substrate-binding protein